MTKLLWTQRAEIGPSPRFNAGMAFDLLRGRTVLFGGCLKAPGHAQASDSDGETWEWDGTNWTQMNDIGPSPRWGHRMAFDYARNQVVLYGGLPLLTDTWAWNGEDWTQLDDLGPSGRNYFALASDAKRKRVVLYGGSGAATVLTDTWEWDGAEWTQVQHVGAGAQTSHDMAYDGTQGQVMLYGNSGETWVWDGKLWTKRTDIGLGKRAFYRMVYNSRTVVLFGGDLRLINDGNPIRDTWEWDGSHWTQRGLMGPAARAEHAMAYDSNRNRVVLFGGRTTQTAELGLRDTWELSEDQPPIVTGPKPS